VLVAHPVSISPVKVCERRWFGRARKWGTRGGLAMMDYGLISGSNFVSAVMLARWMSLESYGGYATAFSIYLLFLLLFQSIVLEPMSVFGCSTYSHCRRAYVQSVKAMCIIGSLVVAGLLALAGLLVYSLGAGGGLPGGLLGLALATPSLFYFWLTRRVFYLDCTPGSAAVGAVFYVVIAIGGLYIVKSHGFVSPFVAFVLMGVASAATDLALASKLAHFLPPSEEGPDHREVLRRHWEYGRWAICSAFGSWSGTNVYYPLLSGVVGLAQAGEMKALMNLTAPLSQTMASVSMLALPYVARRGTEHATQLSRNLTFVFVGLGAAYWAIVLPFQSHIFQFLYKGAYATVVGLVPLFALMSVLNSALNGPIVMLRGLNLPESVFTARVGGAIASMAIGIPATWMYGLYGATAGVILASVLTFLIGQALLNKRLRP
jgi:O-antigen/teichoic acid export membrane protein